jgi:hypothetical protein
MKFSYAYIAAQFLGLVCTFSIPAHIAADAVGRANGILTYLIIASEAGVRNATVAPALGVSRFRGG